MTRNEQVLKFLVERSGRTFGRTQLVKLVYMADCEARRYLGVPISQFQWARDHQGPFDDAFYEAKEGLVEKGLMTEGDDVTPSGNVRYRYANAGPEGEFGFSKEEERLLEYVIDVYGRLPLNALLNRVYDTAPFKKVQTLPRGTPVPMEIENDAKKQELGGLDLCSVLEGEERLKAGEGIPLTELLATLRA